MDLKNELLPHVSLDYLTLLCRTPYDQGQLFTQLKNIKPDLKLCNLDDKEKKKEMKYGEFRDEKYAELESKNDVIYHVLPYPNPLYHHQVKIAGAFAHEVFLAILEGSVDITLCGLTRFDLNVRPPGFVLGDYNKKREELLEFYELHKDSEFNDSSKKGFAIVRLGSRKSARFERTYISKSGDKMTFEIELKREIADEFFSSFLALECLEINKLFLFEILACLKRLNYCNYTKVLIDWGRHELLPLKEEWFSDHHLVKRRSVQKLEGKPSKGVPLVPCKITDVVNTRSNVLNYNVIEVMDVSKKDNALLVMILIYCSELLFEKWKERKDHGEIEHQIHKLNWNSNQTSEYSIEFKLPDLLDFLSLKNNSNTRLHVTKLLSSLFKKQVTFKVDSVSYLQSFVQSLAIKQQRGKETLVQLELHKFVTYDLLNRSILFKKSFHAEFQKLSQNCSDKGIMYLFAHRLFLNLITGVATKNEIYIKNAIMSRNRNNKDYRQKHFDLTYVALDLLKKHYRIEIGLKLNGISEVPVSKEFLSQVFLPYSNKVLEKAQFDYHVISQK